MNQPRTFSGARLRKARLKAGKTLAGVAGFVGYSTTLIHYWETGARVPGSGQEYLLEAALGVRKYYFRVAAVDAAGPGSGLRKGAIHVNQTD